MIDQKIELHVILPPNLLHSRMGKAQSSNNEQPEKSHVLDASGLPPLLGELLPRGSGEGDCQTRIHSK